MKPIVAIIKQNTAFTTYKFYTEFLLEVAEQYRLDREKVDFRLFENVESSNFTSKYYIDPIAIPLLLSLLEQLKNFHKLPLKFVIEHVPRTNDTLEFLYKSGFLHLATNNVNPTYPRGKYLIDQDINSFGGFKSKKYRVGHKVRSYSLNGDNLKINVEEFQSEEEQRDFLISFYTYKVREHFEELLFESSNTHDNHNLYIDILSELITNGVLHSKSDTYALMFLDRFNVKFSISDNGIGLASSLKNKVKTLYYSPQQLINELREIKTNINVSKEISENLYYIFETLYYSALKDRRGLFDLMISTVLNGNGYFRLHSENCQIIISNRISDELIKLNLLRKTIYDNHNKYALDTISKDTFNSKIISVSTKLKNQFVSFYSSIMKKYTDDIQYSSVRFYKVKFRGVHIEVELPNIEE